MTLRYFLPLSHAGAPHAINEEVDMSGIRRWVGGVALVAALAGTAGCGPVTMASVAVSGVSFAFTGKGLTEHALSEIRGEDCAVVHLLDREPMCLPYAGAEPPMAVAAVADTWHGVAPASGPAADAVATTPADDPVLRYMMRRVQEGWAAPPPAEPVALAALPDDGSRR